MSASKKFVTFQIGQDSPLPLSQLLEGPAGSIVTVTPEWGGLEKLSTLQPPKFQNRSSPPFHPGGRGAKQLSKALEQCTEAEELTHSSPHLLAAMSSAIFRYSPGSSRASRTTSYPLKHKPGQLPCPGRFSRSLGSTPLFFDPTAR